MQHGQLCQQPIHCGDRDMYLQHRQFDKRQEEEGDDDRNRIQCGIWATGVFNCLDSVVPNALMSWLCGWITMAQVVTRVGIINYSNALVVFGLLQALLHGTCIVLALICDAFGFSLFGVFIPVVGVFGFWEPLIGYDRSCSSKLFYSTCGIHLISWLLLVLAVAIVRFKIGQHFEIRGSVLRDVGLSLACTCCVEAQMASHVKTFERGKCSGFAPDVIPPYVWS